LKSLVPYPGPYFVATIVPTPGAQCSPPVTPASESRVPSSTSPQFRAQCSSPGPPSRLPVSLPHLYPYFPIVATHRYLPYSTPLPFPTAQPVTWRPSPLAILSRSTFLRIVGSSSLIFHIYRLSWVPGSKSNPTRISYITD